MKRLSKNLTALFSADMIRRLLGFVTVAYLARVLGTSGFGSISLGFAVLAYGLVLSSAGLPTLGTRRIARDNDLEIIGQIFGARLALTSFVFAFIMFSSMLCIGDSVQRWLIVIFALTLFPQIFFLDWFFQGKETMGIVGTVRVVSSAVYTVVSLFFVHSPDQVLYVAVGAVLGDTAAAVLMILRFKKLYPEFSMRVRPSLVLLKQSFPLSIGIVIATLVINYPPLILAFVQSKSEVGIYSAASKLVFFLLMGDRMLSSVLLPASARKYSESPQALALVINDANRWILVLVLPIAIGGLMLSEQLITLIFGPAYNEASGVLKIFVWYFFITMLHTVFTSGLIAMEKEKTYGSIMLATAVLYGIFVTSGAIFFGALGAAFGVVLAEGISVLMMWHALKNYLLLIPPLTTTRILSAALVLELFLVVCIEWNIFILILMGAAVYFSALFLLRAIHRDDIHALIAKFA